MSTYVGLRQFWGQKTFAGALSRTKHSTFNTKFKTRTDELGNTFASINDLIPSELNKQIYGSEDKENSKIDEICLDMKKRLSKGLVANSVPIPVYPSGKMRGGHTRQEAGIKAGAEELQINVLSQKEEDEIKQKISDAEEFAEEDKRRKARVELRNTADSIVYQTRRTRNDRVDRQHFKKRKRK